ncbi:2329_t:CDS:10 [Paraglomus occultum]|uniref:2329_t:CDS:1 n=1 Tax=Paraglomus occultum TaxID=144539 RepID=A0A9N9BKS8_9GLOM|nr:2329_t:CDS:10 [Paraglomus occultum]
MINKLRYLLLLLLFVLIFVFLPSVWAVDDNSSVYEDNDNLVFFDGHNGFTYPDGTGLMQLHINDSLKYENNLYIRLLHQNGTLTKFTVPTYNFTNYQPHAYPLNDGYMLVAQANDDKIMQGMLVDWSGQVLQSVTLTDGPIDTNSKLYAKTNVNPDKDFLVATKVLGEVQWKIFSAPNSTGQITQLYNGSITRHDGNALSDFSIFPSTEGGYGIAVLENILNYEDPHTFHSIPQWFLYVEFWQPETLQFDTPHSIWQSPNPTYNTAVVGCEVAADGTGYFCIIEVPRIDGNRTTIGICDYVKVAFLSSGSVTGVNVILTDNWFAQEQMNGIRQLPYGGLLFLDTIRIAEGTYHNVTVKANNGTTIATFELDPTDNWSMPHSHFGDYAIFPNNTLWMGDRYVNQSWLSDSTLVVHYLQLPKLLPEDAGFNNLLVNSSIPQLGSSVSLDTTNITLIFRDQIVLSTQNISIYQTTDKNPILRQSFNAKSDFNFCSVTLDDSAVTCKIFKSTFNQPGATYDVIVDNNFVMSKSLGQPLPGVTKGNWVYYGASSETDGKYKYTETTTGLLRLTSATSSEQLFTDDKNSFLDAMVAKLAELIPIDPSRITTSRRNQPDPDAPDQILFQITLKSTEDLSQRTVQQIIDDLDDLIRNKAYNAFSREYPTSYLDETYGFSPIANLWETYKVKLIGLFAGLLILSVIYFFARRKYPEGQSFVVVKLTLILVDLSLDITFVLTNARNVPQLYMPSIAFLIAPIAFNSALAFSILMAELSKNTKFQEWFSRNVRITSIFTLLASADIEVITCLGSKFAGWQMFSAPLSKKAVNYVFWGSTLNLFIEDIPQLVIQVLYRYLTVSYDIIPFLSLIMSSIVLTFNIIGHVYDGYIRWKEKKLGHIIPKEEI